MQNRLCNTVREKAPGLVTTFGTQVVEWQNRYRLDSPSLVQRRRSALCIECCGQFVNGSFIEKIDPKRCSHSQQRNQ